MKLSQFLPAIFFALLSLTPVSAQDESDKIGTVDMQKLLESYHKTKLVEEEFKGYSEEVVKQDETRKETINDLVTRFRDLQKEIDNPNLPKEKQEALFQQAMSQQREIQARQNERMEWLQLKNAAFAEKRNIDLGELRVEILEIVKEVGEANGFDFIFDRSGASGANILILAYAKDATDLTGMMLEKINKDAPEKSEEEDKEIKPEEKAGE